VDKLVYALWKADATPIGELRRRLLEQAGPRLLAAGVPRLSISVADLPQSLEASVPVRDAAGRVAALANVWLDDPAARATVLRELSAAADRVAGYAVDESIPRWYHDRTWPDGTRTPGANLVTFLVANPALSREAFMHEWHDVHTPLSLEIHPLWCYVRNVVREILTPGAPAWPGIVEEHFRRVEDVTDPERFYSGVANAKRVLDHCRKFLDLERIETQLMSEYWLRSHGSRGGAGA
jgi:hypothetical protein